MLVTSTFRFHSACHVCAFRRQGPPYLVFQYQLSGRTAEQGGRDAGAGGLVSGSEGQTPGGGISYHSHQKCLSAAIH